MNVAKTSVPTPVSRMAQRRRFLLNSATPAPAAHSTMETSANQSKLSHVNIILAHFYNTSFVTAMFHKVPYFVCSGRPETAGSLRTAS